MFDQRKCYMLADVIIFVYEVPCVFWHYINVEEVSWITLKKLLQSAMDCYYKLRHLFYYKVRHGLLQIATGITKCDGFITNCDRYYKVQWLLQIATVQQLVVRALASHQCHVKILRCKNVRKFVKLSHSEGGGQHESHQRVSKLFLTVDVNRQQECLFSWKGF